MDKRVLDPCCGSWMFYSYAEIRVE